MKILNKIKKSGNKLLKTNKEGQIFEIKKNKNQYYVVVFKGTNNEIMYTDTKQKAIAVIEQIEHLIDWSKYRSLQDLFRKNKEDYSKISSILEQYATPNFRNGNYLTSLNSDNQVNYLMNDVFVKGKHYRNGVAIREGNGKYHLDFVFADVSITDFTTQENAKLFFETIEAFLPYTKENLKELIKADKNIKNYLKELRNSIEIKGEPLPISPELRENFRYQMIVKEKNEEKEWVYKVTMAELGELVGLAAIKETINNFLKMQSTEKMLREEIGQVKSDSRKFGYHSLFLGNPGTGKTEVARLFADLLWSLGLIEERKLTEVSKEDLVSQYVGGTEENTQKKISEAIGGVLFVDEAYMLAENAGNDNNGKVALELIMRAMENHRENLVVIFAGYEEEIEKLLSVNPGLKSRFVYTFHFEDFTIDELTEIAARMIKSEGFNAVNVLEELKQVIQKDMKDGKLPGNARAVRNIVKKVIDQHKLSLSNRETESIVVINPKTVRSLLQKGQARNEEAMKKLRKEAEEELMNLIGLDDLKESVQRWIKHIAVQKRRFERGRTTRKPTLHMTFKGNPGTGKTTVARIIGKLLRSLDLLSKGHFIEASRSDLVGEYQGHTAIKVKELIKKALGGILFIDEAYSLVQGENDTFGKEAVDTLIAEMENNRDDLVVILAGYEDEINQLFRSNPGFKSRVPNHFYFIDYNAEELYQLFKLQIKNELDITEDALETVQKLIKEAKEAGKITRDEGNGRWVRNFIDKIDEELTSRVFDDYDADDSLIIKEDVIKGYERMMA